MANQKELTNLVRTLEDELLKDLSVMAFWIHGSRSAGTSYEHSDLDIAILVEKEENESYVKELLKKHIDYHPDFVEYFLDTTSDYWEYLGTEVGVHIITLPEFNSKIEELFESVENFEKNQTFIQHVIIESEVIFDRNSVINQSVERVTKIPEKLRNELVELYLKRLNQKIIWWEKRPVWKSVFERITDIRLIVDEIARCHYALNGKYHMTALKQYNRDLEILMPDVKDIVFEIVKVDPDNYAGKETRELIKRVVKKLEEYYEEIK